jgi:hypothetical protein
MTFAALAPPKGKTYIAIWLTNDPAVLFGAPAVASPRSTRHRGARPTGSVKVRSGLPLRRLSGSRSVRTTVIG